MKTLSRSTVSLFALPVLLALSLPQAVHAQDGALAGTVRDSASQAPLSAVLVEVVSSNGAVVATGTSGPGGAFRIIQIPAGTYSVRFTSPGWRSTTMDGQVVTAGQTTSFQAAMVEQSYNLNPITVTTSRTEEKVLDAPASVQVVRTARIEARPTTTPVDHVRDEAGVDIIQTGLQSSYVVVRGFNNIFSGATLTLTDNRIARVPSLRANISHLNPITNMDLERMEVVLGPGSALYGPNAANGVVHSITKSPIDYPGVNLSIAGGTRRGAENALPNDSLRNEPMMHAEGRVALAPSDKFGFKVSGQYFDGTEFPFIDPEEAEQQVIATACQGTGYDLTNPACLNFSEGLDLTNSEDQAVLKQSVDNVAKGRQHNLRRWTLDARVDWRPNPETSLIVGGGRTNANSSVDLTGIGAGQVTNWAYNYAQARFQWKELFAQFFMNWSDNEETYLLRSGRPLIDKSQLLVGQLQHSSRLGSNHRLVYGVDMLRTIPKSEGTINGQNEDDDDIWEVGGYAQWEWTINQKLDFVGAMRLDDHSLLQDLVFSPRAAFVYKPNQENSFRLTWNRAYSTPSTLNFFLDISSGSLPLGASGFRYDVRAQGATKNGLRFVRDDGTPRHMSPFAPFLGLEGVDQRTLLPTNAQTLWGEGLVVMGGAAQAGAITPAQFAALAQIAAPTDGDVGIIPLTLDPSLALGSDPTSDCPAPPFCLTPGGLEGVQDISPLKPTINNTIELGYTGLVAERLLIGINGWYSRITDYISALRVSTPNLFLNPVELGQYVALKLIEGGMSLAEAQQLATTTATLVGQTPLGVVTPENVGGTDATLALAYQNLGSFDLFGGEIAATYLLGDAWEIDGTFSMVSKDRFTAARGDETEEVPLNAPKYKGTAAVRFNYDNVGLNGGVRFRSQIGFPGNSGVYIGDVKGYEVFDISLGWRIPGFRELWLQLDVQNVFDTQYQPFIGTPELGRFAILRARYDWSPF